MIQLYKQPNGKYRCLYCDKAEYQFTQGLYRHHKECSMNPDRDRDAKKRKLTHSDSGSDRSRSPSPRKSPIDEDALTDNRESARKAYEKLMKINCDNPVVVRRVFKDLDPIPKGMLEQMFMDADEEYNLRVEEFTADTRINAKVKTILAAIDPDQQPTEASTATTTSTSSSSSGILGGMFTSRK
jgi:hypothetical protein